MFEMITLLLTDIFYLDSASLHALWPTRAGIDTLGNRTGDARVSRSKGMVALGRNSFDAHTATLLFRLLRSREDSIVSSECPGTWRRTRPMGKSYKVSRDTLEHCQLNFGPLERNKQGRANLHWSQRSSVWVCTSLLANQKLHLPRSISRAAKECRYYGIDVDLSESEPYDRHHFAEAAHEHDVSR